MLNAKRYDKGPSEKINNFGLKVRKLFVVLWTEK